VLRLDDEPLALDVEEEHRARESLAYAVLVSWQEARVSRASVQR
jgi:hypothetical protein